MRHRRRPDVLDGLPKWWMTSAALTLAGTAMAVSWILAWVVRPDADGRRAEHMIMMLNMRSVVGQGFLPNGCTG
jgi:hypothetical protein